MTCTSAVVTCHLSLKHHVTVWLTKRANWPSDGSVLNHQTSQSGNIISAAGKTSYKTRETFNGFGGLCRIYKISPDFYSGVKQYWIVLKYSILLSVLYKSRWNYCEARDQARAQPTSRHKLHIVRLIETIQKTTENINLSCVWITENEWCAINEIQLCIIAV